MFNKRHLRSNLCGHSDMYTIPIGSTYLNNNLRLVGFISTYK